MLRKSIVIPLTLLLLMLAVTPGLAATYYYDTGLQVGGSGGANDLAIVVTGYNRTEGFRTSLNWYTSTYTSSSRTRWRINYEVPDDGSVWDVTGIYVAYLFDDGQDSITRFTLLSSKSFTATHTTSGTFTGVSVKQAVNAANNAKISADSAKVAAANAQTAANTAATKAASALTAANSANINASNAYSSVYNTNGNTITAVRDAGGTVLAEARQAKTNSENTYNTALAIDTKIDSLSNAVTNIQNNLGADTSPPSVKITTVSGALATSAASIRSVINASDNVSAFFEYSLDGAWYQTLPQDGVISLPVNSPGSNLITVWVKDEAGNIGRDSITIRKL